jgi:hypothetical protein
LRCLDELFSLENVGGTVELDRETGSFRLRAAYRSHVWPNLQTGGATKPFVVAVGTLPGGRQLPWPPAFTPA